MTGLLAAAATGGAVRADTDNLPSSVRFEHQPPLCLPDGGSMPLAVRFGWERADFAQPVLYWREAGTSGFRRDRMSARGSGEYRADLRAGRSGAAVEYYIGWESDSGRFGSLFSSPRNPHALRPCGTLAALNSGRFPR